MIMQQWIVTGEKYIFPKQFIKYLVFNEIREDFPEKDMIGLITEEQMELTKKTW